MYELLITLDIYLIDNPLDFFHLFLKIFDPIINLKSKYNKGNHIK